MIPKRVKLVRASGLKSSYFGAKTNKRLDVKQFGAGVYIVSSMFLALKELDRLVGDLGGNLYIIDSLQAQNDSRLLRISQNGVPGVVADLTQTTTPWGMKGVVVNPNQILFMTLSSL